MSTITLPDVQLRVKIELEINCDNDPPTSHIHLGFTETFRRPGFPEVWSGSYEADWLDETEYYMELTDRDEQAIHDAVEAFEA